MQKALGGMGGHKLNISTEEDKDKDKDKNKLKFKDNKKTENTKRNNSKDIHEKEYLNDKNNIELLKTIFIDSDNKTKNNKTKFPNLNLITGPHNENNDNLKKWNLKIFLEKINQLPMDYKNYEFNFDKKIVNLSKNKNILGNKNIFSTINKNNFKNLDAFATLRKDRKMVRNYSMNIKKNKFVIKKKKKDTFLLFAKARPYRYMANKDNNDHKDNNDNKDKFTNKKNIIILKKKKLAIVIYKYNLSFSLVLFV